MQGDIDLTFREMAGQALGRGRNGGRGSAGRNYRANTAATQRRISQQADDVRQNGGAYVTSAQDRFRNRNSTKPKRARSRF